MNKLEVGMYVRTKYGIRKINEIDEDNNYYIDKTYINDFRQKIDCITDNCIIGKPSFNPIDLIEVGDYVNGKKVLEKIYHPTTLLVTNYKETKKGIKQLQVDAIILEKDIKTVVTKEQFKSVSYRLGD